MAFAVLRKTTFKKRKTAFQPPQKTKMGSCVGHIPIKNRAGNVSVRFPTDANLITECITMRGWGEGGEVGGLWRRKIEGRVVHQCYRIKKPRGATQPQYTTSRQVWISDSRVLKRRTCDRLQLDPCLFLFFTFSLSLSLSLSLSPALSPGARDAHIGKKYCHRHCSVCLGFFLFPTRQLLCSQFFLGERKKS